MARPRLLALAVAASAVSVSAVALAGPSEPTEPANATPYSSSLTAGTYAVYDGNGTRAGVATWHWTSAGGNCCEVYVSSTSKGRLLEYGGTWPFISDDHGRTWQRIVPPTPLRSGEGAIVAGPGGNVFGIGWDPYTGDHLQGLRYTASSKKWEVAEAVLHSPFFDREWISYVKGPFVDGSGKQVPYLTLVRGGGVTKTLEVIATDGISYTTPTVPHADVQTNAEPRFFSIPVAKNPDADWWQPNPGTYTLPLSGGGVLLLDNRDDDLGAPAAWLNPTTLKWERVRLAFNPTGTLRQDSRGWLTMLTRRGNDLTLSLSPNGGRSWLPTTLTLPTSYPKIEGTGDFFDVKVDGHLGQALVVTRADNKQQLGLDVAWRVDIRSAQPRVLKTYAVGKGDISTTIGVLGSLANRFDFPSGALLPDGRIAVSFDDSTTPLWTSADGLPTTGSVVNPKGHSPALAILD
jgi:hypothetical protein